MKTKTLIWIAAFAMMLLTSCRTNTTVEYIAVHDTLHIARIDTLYKVKTEVSHDTLRIETEKIVTVGEQGDTIKIEIYKDRWRDRIIHQVDTIREKSTDTIYVSKNSSYEKETVIKKKSFLKPVLVTAFLALMIALCFIIYKRR